MKKLTIDQRMCQIYDVVEHMNIDDVIWFEMAIQGKRAEQIEKEIGTMSSKQWKNCLIISLEELIGLECKYGKNTKKLHKQVKARKRL